MESVIVEAEFAKLHPVDATLKRRFVERLQERARALREATTLSRWDEAKHEVRLLRNGGERFAFPELERQGRLAEAALPVERNIGVFPGLRKASIFQSRDGFDPSPQIDALLRAVDAVVAEEGLTLTRRSS